MASKCNDYVGSFANNTDADNYISGKGWSKQVGWFYLDSALSLLKRWDGVSWVLQTPSAFTTVTNNDYTLNAGSAIRTLYFSTGAVNRVLNLGLASAFTGARITVKKIDNDIGTVTIDPSGAETIEGNNTITLNAQYQSIAFVSTGTLWYVVDISPPEQQWYTDVAVVANSTLSLTWHASVPIRVQGIALRAMTPPVTAGTYTFAATGAGNNLLSAATFNLTTLVADTLTPIPLTNTLANRSLAANAKVQFDFVSNNLDLTGAGLYARISYTPRLNT